MVPLYDVNPKLNKPPSVRRLSLITMMRERERERVLRLKNQPFFSFLFVAATSAGRERENLYPSLSRSLAHERTEDKQPSLPPPPPSLPRSLPRPASVSSGPIGIQFECLECGFVRIPKAARNPSIWIPNPF